MKKKLGFTGLLAVLWLATIALANMLLAPAMGAATVLQMDASNTSYLASMFMVSGAPLLTVVISGMFALAIYLVTRTQE